MRSSGILLPIFSLPGKYGIGCFSKEAYSFVDFLCKCKQKYWQILPLGPTSYGDSPYQSFSVFAGNPYFIDLENLIERGLLDKKEVDKANLGKYHNKIEYNKLYKYRFALLRKAYEESHVNDDPMFHEFKRNNDYWLRDYALFMALKDFFGEGSFDEWPEDIRKRYQYSLDYYQEQLYFEIEFYEFIQYEFHKQWYALKAYANEKGVQIIGDIPIYVAYDSADVWAHPELFWMDQEGKPVEVAGCPPDGFSDLGQLWGNPLYNWDYHRNTGFDWWVRRMAKCRELYDVIRIDHFRGFDEYYSVPYGANDATLGCWKKGPGIDLFNTINYRLPGMHIIAEDLGYVTDSVRHLVNQTGYPNMKVLQFAFDMRDSSGPADYLPYNYDKNCVVYTGTHDNDTIYGFLNTISMKEKVLLCTYLGNTELSTENLAEGMLRLVLSSSADMCIIPLQDYLGLGSEARINTPSTLGKNWKWRFKKADFSEELIEKIKKGTLTYGRA